MQAFIQYSRQFTQPLTQVASMANVLQSGSRLGGAGLRIARRRRAVTDPVNPVQRVQTPRGRVEFEDIVTFRYDPTRPR